MDELRIILSFDGYWRGIVYEKGAEFDSLVLVLEIRRMNSFEQRWSRCVPKGMDENCNLPLSALRVVQGNLYFWKILTLVCVMFLHNPEKCDVTWMI